MRRGGGYDSLGSLTALGTGSPPSRIPAIIYQPAIPQPTSFMIAFLQQDKGNERPGLRVCAGLEFARLSDCSPTARQREPEIKGTGRCTSGNVFARMGPSSSNRAERQVCPDDSFRI